MERRFTVGHATGGDWSVAFAAALADAWPAPSGANLGFVFATDYLAPHFDEIVARLRQETGIQDWSGTVGIGIATPEGEIFDRPALAIMMGAFPPDSFRAFGPFSAAPRDFVRREQAWLDRQLGTVALLQADSRTPDLQVLLSDFAESAKAFPLGGLTASRAGPASAIAGRAPGLTGVLFGDGVPLVSGLSQGCRPLGPARQITAAEDNVIAEIDGRPALEVVVELVDEHFDGRLAEAWPCLHPAFPLPGRDLDAYVVRNFVGMDPARGLIAIGDLVEPGQKLLICRRDPASAIEDLNAMTSDVARRAAGRAQAGIYFSCIARGPGLFGPDGGEVKRIQATLGNLPLIGFYAGGEICGDRLYAYTGVLALFV